MNNHVHVHVHALVLIFFGTEGTISTLSQSKAKEFPAGGGHRLEFTVPSSNESVMQEINMVENVNVMFSCKA